MVYEEISPHLLLQTTDLCSIITAMLWTKLPTVYHGTHNCKIIITRSKVAVVVVAVVVVVFISTVSQFIYYHI